MFLIDGEFDFDFDCHLYENVPYSVKYYILT